MTVVNASIPPITEGGLTRYGRSLRARMMYDRGKSFLVASVLLKRQAGGDDAAALHLLMQGAEIILKGLLLLKDYDKYNPLLRRNPRTRTGYGHDVAMLCEAACIEFGLRAPRTIVCDELKNLSDLYNNHLLRYSSIRDIFIESRSIERERFTRRLIAAIRLSEREIAKLD